MKSRTRTRVVVHYEPFAYPRMPYVVYEINENELPVKELGRYESYEEALRVIRREGWIY